MTTPLPQIMPGAEPFFFRGDGTGCLCLHGFTASPAEVRWLGAHLAGCGFTVYGARLVGHGTNPRDMTRIRWEDWFASALDGYHLLRAQCDRVVLVGHSMGGMLSLLLASQVAVDGVAALAAPVFFRSRRMASAPYLKYILRFTDQTDRSPLPETVRAEQARRGEPVRGRVRYNLWSTSAVAELYELSKVVYAHLPQITAPLLLVYSDADRTVSLEHRDTIAARVASQHVRVETISGSDHILPQDHQREAVFDYVADFVTKLNG